MAIPSWTQTIDNLFTSTWSYRQQTAVEQAFLKTPFIYWMRQKGHIQNLSGHTRIEIPLEYGSNETVRWIGKGSTVPIQDSELITMCYDDWKYVAVSIARWFTEDQQNRGKAQMINMVNIKLNAAERSLYEDLERVIFADGTGAKEPNGLQNLISSTPTSGTVHGLDRSTYTWWQNQQKTSSGSAALYLASDMRTCLNDISKYSRSEIKDICLVTNQTVFELYEDTLMDMKILSNTMMADAGFDSIQFKGKPIMWCPSAPDGNMYFINPMFLQLVCDDQFFMQLTDKQTCPSKTFSDYGKASQDELVKFVCW